jgi:hypothetical protein
MKNRQHADRMREFTVTAHRGDVEIGRCVVQALDQEDAIIDGSEELSTKLALGLFDDTVTYRVEGLDASRA